MKNILLILAMSAMLIGCQKTIDVEPRVPIVPNIPTHEILFTVSPGANMAYGVNELNEFNYLYVPFEKTLTIKELDTLFIKIQLGSEWIEYEIFQDGIWRAAGGGKGYLTTFVIKP